MLIKKDGIFRNVPVEEFGIWQNLGFEKVVTEPSVEEQPKEEPLEEVEHKPELEVVEEVVEPDQPFQEELPKSKKKNKNK